jgi:hypothetical protein
MGVVDPCNSCTQIDMVCSQGTPFHDFQDMTLNTPDGSIGGFHHELYHPGNEEASEKLLYAPDPGLRELEGLVVPQYHLRASVDVITDVAAFHEITRGKHGIL